MLFGGYLHPHSLYGVSAATSPPLTPLRGGGDAVSVKLTAIVTPQTPPYYYAVVTTAAGAKYMKPVHDPLSPAVLFVVSPTRVVSTFLVHPRSETPVRPLTTVKQLSDALREVSNPDGVSALIDLAPPRAKLSAAKLSALTTLLEQESYVLLVDTSSRETPPFNTELRPSTLDLSAAQSWLQPLNQRLQQVCPTLHMELALLTDHRGEVSVYDAQTEYVTLCMYYNGNCVASISATPTTYKHYASVFEIRRATLPDLEGRQFSKLITAAFVLLAPTIKYKGAAIENLLSLAVADASAWMLLGTYACQLPEPEDERVLGQKLAELRQQPDSAAAQKKAITKHLNMVETIDIIVPLSEANRKTAHGVFGALTRRGTAVRCDDL